MPAKAPASIYQLKVTLKQIRPPIWRRIQVPADIRLAGLHDVLQTVMGWQDYHLHAFTIAGVQYFQDPETAAELDGRLEGDQRLNALVKREGARFLYEYDFGDGWEHDILVEKILPAQPGVVYPLCVKGARACPPEDVGGPWGYETYLEALADPDHEEHASYVEWRGGGFDATAFDLDAVNEALRQR